MKNSLIITSLIFISLTVILHSCKKVELPELSTVAITNITATSASSGGDILSDGGVAIVSKGVCWSKSSGPTLADQKTNDGVGSSNFNSSITGLQINTKYYVRAYATNSAGTSYGNEIMFTTRSHSKNQIIADHTIVADFDKIPAKFIAEVKKMMVCILGESHSSAYEKGLELLATAYPEYACNISNGEAYTDQYLRVNSASDTGEDIWFSWYAYPLESRPSASNSIKNRIKDYSEHGHPIHALGFGWCWDMVATNMSSTVDPDYGCHWFGRSDGGPDGNKCFGLDPTDFSITGNSVCMDTYFKATEDYISYCKTNGYVTRMFYTTGPVDNRGEQSYQGFIKHELIRNFVKEDSTRILFDYADILCYDDDGKLTTFSWNGHEYPSLTMTNFGDGSIGHIGPPGAIRLAKAQWWMLARIAGWDGK